MCDVGESTRPRTRICARGQDSTSFFPHPKFKLNQSVQVVERMFQSTFSTSMPAISAPCRLHIATLQPHAGRKSKFLEGSRLLPMMLGRGTVPDCLCNIRRYLSIGVSSKIRCCFIWQTLNSIKEPANRVNNSGEPVLLPA